eukprot:558310-Ditylum_brightwellii.AAC.1
MLRPGASGGNNTHQNGSNSGLEGEEHYKLPKCGGIIMVLANNTSVQNIIELYGKSFPARRTEELLGMVHKLRDDSLCSSGSAEKHKRRKDFCAIDIAAMVQPNARSYAT